MGRGALWAAALQGHSMVSQSYEAHLLQNEQLRASIEELDRAMRGLAIRRP
jgi:hypothetical protein